MGPIIRISQGSSLCARNKHLRISTEVCAHMRKMRNGTVASRNRAASHEGFRVTMRTKGRPQISPLRYAAVEMTILFEIEFRVSRRGSVELQIPPRHAA